MGIFGYRDYVEYRAAGRHEFGHRLWFGHMEAGDDVESLLAESPPTQIRRLDGWVWASYLSSPDEFGASSTLNLTVRDGKLMEAAIDGDSFARPFVIMPAAERHDLDRVEFIMASKVIGEDRRKQETHQDDFNP
ncbi:MAG: hypothetical protein C0483_01450 [Pirellula sp.]|nr:hypothetical protein [Pirellula sp.]